jgi:hypothetical protein
MAMHSVLVTAIGVKKLSDQRAEMTSAMIEINKELALYPDALIICSFRCALPEYALTMALIFSPQLISDKTTKKLKNFYDYDIFVGEFVSVGRPSLPYKSLPEFLSKYSTVLLITPHLYPPLNALPLIPINITRSQSIYKLKN